MASGLPFLARSRSEGATLPTEAELHRRHEQAVHGEHTRNGSTIRGTLKSKILWRNSWSLRRKDTFGDFPIGDDPASQSKDAPVATPAWTLGPTARFLIKRCFIVLLMDLKLWVPGFIYLSATRPDATGHSPPEPRFGGVPLIYWSLWLSIIWTMWFILLPLTEWIPRLIKNHFLGRATLTPSKLRKWLHYLIGIHRYVTLFLESILLYILWLYLIVKNISNSDHKVNSSVGATVTTRQLEPSISVFSVPPAVTHSAFESATAVYDTMTRFLFVSIICAGLLLGEKIFIQATAYSFHQATYADRLASSRWQVDVLAALLGHDSEIREQDATQPQEMSRTDSQATITSDQVKTIKTSVGAAIDHWLERAHTRLHDTVEEVVKRPYRDRHATVLGKACNKLRQHAGLLSEHDAKFLVLTAMKNEEEAKKLGERVFSALMRSRECTHQATAAPVSPLVTRADIARRFPIARTVDAVVNLLRNRQPRQQHGHEVATNDTLSLPDFERVTCSLFTERSRLEASLYDIDSAVEALDHFLLIIYTFIAFSLLSSTTLSSAWTMWIASLGSVFLSISWLFSASTTEIVSSIIFLIHKHPYDTGDHIGFFSCSNASEFANNREGCMIELKVVQMKLLSTRFREVERGEDVMISNEMLAKQVIVNHTRSQSSRRR